MEVGLVQLGRNEMEMVRLEMKRKERFGWLCGKKEEFGLREKGKKVLAGREKSSHSLSPRIYIPEPGSVFFFFLFYFFLFFY